VLRGVLTIGVSVISVVGLQAGIILLACANIIQRVLTLTPARHQVLQTLRLAVRTQLSSSGEGLSYLWTKMASKYLDSH